MSVAVATASTAEPRAISIGPRKIQIMKLAVVSGDTSATVTATNLTSIDEVLVGGGLIMTVAPSISGNVATLTFGDPVANRFSTVLCIGR